jgi:hypothetical protein
LDIYYYVNYFLAMGDHWTVKTAIADGINGLYVLARGTGNKALCTLPYSIPTLASSVAG